MKIYTRTGDAGQTGLIGGGRIPKDHLRVAAIGDVDELNAAIGWARSMLQDTNQGEIAEIQSRLFDIGAELANPVPSGPPQLLAADVQVLEESIDRMSESLPPLRAFILPGGCPAAAALHVARTVCRRAERSVIAMSRHNAVAEPIRAYLNRLSDWLFVAARTGNAAVNVPDVEWHARR